MFSHDLVSKLKSELPEIKSHEAPDQEDEHSETVCAASPQHSATYSSYRTPDVSHQIISSYFIGPQAENLSYFEDNIHTVLEELRLARNKYYPEDGVSC